MDNEELIAAILDKIVKRIDIITIELEAIKAKLDI